MPVTEGQQQPRTAMTALSRLSAAALAIFGAALTLCATPAAGPWWGRAGLQAPGALVAARPHPLALRAPGTGQMRGPAAGDRRGAAPAKPPVFPYYYIWMHGDYWTRDKLDHPVRPFPGNYNSDNPAVIRWQVRQARAAGITGFIVSWKDTPRYRQILPLVEQAANRGGLKLAMLYEALDHARQPLPVAQVAEGFRYFAATYATNPAWYRIGGKPLTIWFGTQRFSRAAVARVTGPVRRRILVLSSANNVAEIHRLAAWTDGDAYYWSSVNPAVDRFYPGKLAAMGAATHRAHKIWVAPFAPGYNTTLIGGHRVVPRDNGATLRTEFATAIASGPDIMGLISWNEWMENTYVEPSLTYRYFYLKVLKKLVGPAP